MLQNTDKILSTVTQIWVSKVGFYLLSVKLLEQNLFLLI